MPSTRRALLALALALPFAAPLLFAPAIAAEAAAATPAPAEVLSFESDAQLATLAAKGTTVVFFYAAWCPNCRATVTELNQNWDKVRPGVTLVIADYDKDQALKARYGVTYQDTFVLLDGKANRTSLWNSGGVKGLNEHTAS